MTLLCGEIKDKILFGKGEILTNTKLQNGGGMEWDCVVSLYNFYLDAIDNTQRTIFFCPFFR